MSPKDPKERMDALEVALNNEMRERAFYHNHATRTKNPVGKAMFQKLGDEELEHYERLKALRETWDKQERWPETVPLKVQKTVVQAVLLKAVKDVAKTAEADADDMEAIKTALEFEANGEKHYADLAEAVRDPKEKEFFTLLSRMEREHYLSLKDTEEYLLDPEGWHTMSEHHGLDGG